MSGNYARITMTVYLRDRQGNREELDFDFTGTQSTVLGRGGAGVIYQHPRDSQKAIKVYHPHFLTSHQHLGAKLASMLALAPGDEKIWDGANQYVQIAWPSALLENNRGDFLGYTMPLVDMKRAVMLEQVLQKKERQRAQIREDYRFRIFVGRNLAGAIWKLHEKGHGIVDLKPVNILVYQNTGFVCLLDCDGYDVQGSGNTRYPADLFTAEYLYPEGHRKKLRPEQVDPIEQDRFALAVILFQLINNGLHPYQGRPISAQVPPSIGERIAEGLYSYGKKKNRRQEPSLQTLHPYFRNETRELFDHAFESKTAYRTRPSAREWLDHFDWLIQQLQDCPINRDHQHFGKGCGLCALSAPAAFTRRASIAGVTTKWIVLVGLLVTGFLVARTMFNAWQAGIPAPAPLTTRITPPPVARPLLEPITPPTSAPHVAENTLPSTATQTPRDTPIIAAAPKPPALSTEPPLPLDPEMVLIPAGTFLMGPPESVAEPQEDAPHRVNVAAFYLGKYPITFAEYDRFVATTVHRKPDDTDTGVGRAQHPVVDISWFDATAYAEWLSQKTGKAYRLPTEAEWESAARAGTTTVYFWGNERGRNHANCNGCGSAWDNKQIAPIGSFAPNPWGLYDMLGNAYQWTCSAWNRPYDGSEQRCQMTGNTNRSYRGGSWFDLPNGIRATVRHSLPPTQSSRVLGFRLARSL